MRFDWDENKRRLNLEKHKIDFAEAVTIYDGFVSTIQDTRNNYGEKRFLSIGLLSEIEIVVVYTPRENGTRRIISARRANITERKKYHAEREKNKD